MSKGRRTEERDDGRNRRTEERPEGREEEGRYPRIEDGSAEGRKKKKEKYTVF